MPPSKKPVYYSGGVPVKIHHWKTRPVVFERPLRYSESDWAYASKLANDAMDSDEQICNWMREIGESNTTASLQGNESKEDVVSQIELNQLKASSGTLNRLDTWLEGVKRHLREVDEEKDEILSVFRDIKEEIDSIIIYEKRVVNCSKSLCVSRLEMNNKSLEIIKSYKFQGDLDTKKIEGQVASENLEVSKIRQYLEKLLNKCQKKAHKNRKLYYVLGKELQNVNDFKTKFIQDQAANATYSQCQSTDSEVKLKLGDTAEQKKIHAIKAITETVELKIKIDEYLAATGKSMQKSTQKTDEMFVEHYRKFLDAHGEWMELTKKLSAGVKKVEAKICKLEKELRERNVCLKQSEDKFKKQNIQKMQGDTIEDSVNDELKNNKKSVKATELQITKAENTLRVLLRHLVRIKDSYKAKPWDPNFSENGYAYLACELKPAWQMAEY